MKQSLRILKARLCIPLLVALAFGCAKKEVEGYRVQSFETATAKWTIIRDGTFDGMHMKKRLTLVCALYKWGDHEAVTGPQACSLRVGQLLVPNPLPGEGKRSEFLDIWEMSPDRLAITQGDGPDKIEQQFLILKEEVVSD
jgi:hypothetical protein